MSALQCHLMRGEVKGVKAAEKQGAATQTWLK